MEFGDKMTNEQQKIEKPWAVYGWNMGAWDIGKVVEEKGHSLGIIYFEGNRTGYSEDQPEVNVWGSKWVKTFDDPIRAMEYFLVNQQYHPKVGKERIIHDFLIRFPSERDNLVKRLPKRFSSEALRMTGHTAKMMSLLDKMRQVPLAQSQPK